LHPIPSPLGLGYVNRWSVGPETQKQRNFKTSASGSIKIIFEQI